MSFLRIIKIIAVWTAMWILIGAVIGILMGLGDTGHVGFYGTILMVATAGAIFGFVGGASFAPVFTWFAHRLSAKPARGAGAALLGTLAGLVGVFVTDRIVGITHALLVGSIAGAVTGVVCHVFIAWSDLGCRRKKRARAPVSAER